MSVVIGLIDLFVFSLLVALPVSLVLRDRVDYLLRIGATATYSFLWHDSFASSAHLPLVSVCSDNLGWIKERLVRAMALRSPTP